MSDDKRPREEVPDDQRGDAREPLSDDERARVLQDELRRLKVADLVRDMMVSIVAVGYQKLGLTTETRPLRDLDDARLAIEALRALIGVLERERGAADVEAFRSTLDAMQLNYVRAADSSGRAPAQDEEQAPAQDERRAPVTRRTRAPAKASKAKASGARAVKGDQPSPKPRKKQAGGGKPAAEGEPASDG